MIEEDREQLILMQKAINKYEQHLAQFDTLLELTMNLEDCMNNLKGVNRKWIDSFRTEWWELEMIIAVMTDKELSQISSDGIQSIDKALLNMKHMILEQFKEI